MHFMFAMRGHSHWGERFINELKSRYLSMPWYNPETKQMQTIHTEMRLCPIQLYDCIFPEEHRDTVLNTCLVGTQGNPISPKLNKYFWGLRKLLGYEKIPEYKKDLVLPMSPPKSCEIIGIGIKDDYWIEPDGKHVARKDKSPLAWEGL